MHGPAPSSHSAGQQTAPVDLHPAGHRCAQEVEGMDPGTPITLAAAAYRSLPAALEGHDAVWDARRAGTFHHSSLAVVVQRSDGTFYLDRTSNTAGFLAWGDGLLRAGLVVLMPRVSARMLPTADLDGGAISRHLYRNVPLDDLVAAAELLESSPVGLVAVVVNRGSDDIRGQLTGADDVHAVDTAWGDLEEGLGGDLALQLGVPPSDAFRGDYVDDVIRTAWRQVSAW
jgi:hypothetical protein